MSIDHPEATAASTSRRSFLTRTAVGGALLTAGTLAVPVERLLTAAGASARADGKLENEAFAEFATPLEMAAVQAYQAAYDAELFSTEQAAQLLEFQSHHQDVVDTLTTLLPEDAVAEPDADIQAQVTKTITASSDPDAVLASLSAMEDTISATHLNAIRYLVDTSTAKTVAQVLAVEAQQGALLGWASGASISAVTPALITTDDAIIPADLASASN